MKRIVRTDRMHIQANSLKALLLGLLLVSCSTSDVIVQSPESSIPELIEPPVPAMSAEEQLSHHGVNAAFYQHTSAEVHQMFRQAFQLARIKMDRNMKDDHTLPWAVVVDVDETVLDNSLYEMEQLAKGKTYDPASWTEWVERRAATPTPGSLEFLKHAKQNGCSVFYITNRSSSEKNATIDNLAALGFPDADSIHVMTRESTSDKSSRRLSVRKSHDVALYMGDQLRDFKESFRDRTENFGKDSVDASKDELDKYFVLTPNAVYGTWRDAISGKGEDELKLQFVKQFIQQYSRD